MRYVTTLALMFSPLSSTMILDCGANDLPEVSGQVLWHEDPCLPGAAVPEEGVEVVVSSGATVITSSLTDAGGFYLFRLNPGPYQVVVYPPRDYPVYFDVTVAEDTNISLATVQADSVFEESELFVDFQNSVTSDQVLALGEELGVRQMESMGAGNVWWVLLAQGQHVTEGINLFEVQPEVEMAEPVFIDCP